MTDQVHYEWTMNRCPICGEWLMNKGLSHDGYAWQMQCPTCECYVRVPMDQIKLRLSVNPK